MSCACRPTRRVGTSSAQARSVSAQAVQPWSLRRPLLTIVMGLDQHRGQITGEWIDTETSEVQRARVAPADRAAVRKFLQRFRGRELEVALEATTGWRFVVEELRRVGAVVHLAEPAETAGLKGPKRRAKGDRADARHLRELLMVKRLPESWIPPDHILDLRAGVRLRHTLSEQRCEWQQRIQAVLYHHGCPQRRSLMVGDGREWLAAQPLPPTAREQITVALAMIDALDAQIAPLDKELRAYARRQVGCKALMAHDGIGALTAVTILAELGDCTRFSSSRQVVRYAGLGHHRVSVRSAPRTRAYLPPGAAGVALGAVRGRRRSPARGSEAPTASTTSTRRSGSGATARACRSRESCSSAPTTRCASSVRRHWHPHELAGARQAPPHTDAPRPAPEDSLPPRPRGRPRKTERPQRFPQRDQSR
jgi:transposase